MKNNIPFLNKLAKAITYVTFPGFWAILGIWINQPDKLLFLGIATLLYVVIPMAFVVYMVHKKRFESIQLSTLKERKLAVPFSFIASLIFIIFLRENDANPNTLIWAFLVSLTILVQFIFVLLSNKVSIHSMGFATFSTNFIFHLSAYKILMAHSFLNFSNSVWYGIIVFIMLAICWARLNLKAHSNQELLIGIALGISLTFVNELLVIQLHL